MLPIKTNIKDYLKKNEEQNNTENKEKKTASSMQALSNQLVSSSINNLNPNGQPIQQGGKPVNG